jgi:hypothetical protein
LTWTTGPISWHTSGTAGKQAIGCTGTGRGILIFRLARPANERFVNAVLGRGKACDRVAAANTACASIDTAPITCDYAIVRRWRDWNYDTYYLRIGHQDIRKSVKDQNQELHIEEDTATLVITRSCGDCRQRAGSCCALILLRLACFKGQRW